MRPSQSYPTTSIYKLLGPLGILTAIFLGWITSKTGIVVPGALVAFPVMFCFVVMVFLNPKIGFISYLLLCFFVSALNRHILGVPFGLGLEAILIVTWLSIIFHRSEKFKGEYLKNDLCILALVWFIINILELAHPEKPSIFGWFYEMRSTTLYWVLTVPLGFLLLNEVKDLKLFIFIIILISSFGAIYGIKQLYLGVNGMEQIWLDDGAAKTHVLWGKLRVFSFYSDAGQFGASQAHISLVCFILALGPFVKWKKLLGALTGILILYGMLISGTRGALFVLIAGGFVFLILSKQIKIIALGSVVAIGLIFILKFTMIGAGNANIDRLRTSLDPQDPSLLVRFKNQEILRDYLISRPFGGGVGVLGAWGEKYNPDKFLSTVPPDSYFVKVWAMYGIVGFIIWFGIVMYITGKCCGIVWNIRDDKLRQILMALTCGTVGNIFASYGNEVINQMPSSVIVYLSWVFIFLGPKFDRQLSNTHG